MAFYPTWQTTTATPTDPSQNWQNQFIQQIPSQNNTTPATGTSTITPLNSLDFQQSYAYPTNGYVQTTGLQFDPNYGRSGATTAYASPTIQRYEFQTQQITPINQVSLQSVSFAPNVTYATGPTTVLLNHHQQHPHYSSPQQHSDQLLGNKQMTMTASLTTSSSGNEMPGYPRVNSVPPRSLNCNGYPGSEYGGNSINTTANNNSITNTSSSQTTNGNQSQMQPPQVPQSPNRQPPRPNSSNHPMYQSPNHYNNGNSNSSLHMSPTTPQAQQSPSHHQSNSGSSTPNNNQHYSGPSHQQSHMQDNQDTWATWTNNGQTQLQSGDLYNQSDRINLNTRLKTMILNKNDKEQQPQQQSQTGHFLSFSHQHLHEQQSLSHLNSNNVNSNNTLDGGGGGFQNSNSNNEKTPQSMDQWKTSPIKQEEQQKTKQDFFEQKQQINEKNIGDPGGGNLNKEDSTPPLKSSIEDDSSNGKDTNNSSTFSSSNNANSNDSNPPNATYPNMSKSILSNTDSNSTKSNNSYMYNSANDYQQHQNMINSIKKEPGEDPMAPAIKTEGYEKNYQNFIRYADFCDTQQPQQIHQYQDQKQAPPLSQYQQDFMQQQQGYYNNYPYHNYPQNYPPHQQGYQHGYMGQQSYQQTQSGHPPPHTSATVANLTNFEQQIPLHTYPIPKHTKSSDQMLPLASIKSEPLSQMSHEVSPPPMPYTNSPSMHVYPLMNESGPSTPPSLLKDSMYNCCRPGSVEHSEHMHHSMGLMPSKNNLIKDEPEDDMEEEPDKIPEKPNVSNQRSGSKKQQPVKDVHNERNNKPEVPECDCFPSDKNPPEPGSYYTHLGMLKPFFSIFNQSNNQFSSNSTGCASTIAELRKTVEDRAGLSGKQMRIEKVLYTGKEGKSSQGCPIAKWVIRRVDPEEKVLFIVKRRQGHR